MVDRISSEASDCGDINEKRLEECMSVYALVFHVSLRDAEGSPVVGLVCDSVPECDQKDKEKIKQMLGDSNIRCLVILDGLVEYKLSSVSRVKRFIERGLVNTVVLYTMRPWSENGRLGTSVKQ